MTILEIVNKNLHLNKETYITFIDLEKCFDKLWLQSGITELWKGGMNHQDAEMILQMNEKAKILINTPVGMTEMIEIPNCVKQGTIYGPKIGSQEVQQVNTTYKKVITIYSPRIQVELEGALTR